MTVSSVVLVSLICLAAPHGTASSDDSDMKLVRFENCEDRGTNEITDELQIVEKSKDKRVLRGYINIPFDYDDTLQLVNFSALNPQGWEIMVHNMRIEKYCSTFSSQYPVIFKHFFTAWGIKEPSCPIKAGNYSVEMDTDLPASPVFGLLPGGSYRMSHALLRGNPPVRIKCTEWYLESSVTLR